MIKSVLRALEKNPNLKLDIDGYTDSIGDATHNQDLSKRRAEAVRTVLISQFGVDAGVFTIDTDNNIAAQTGTPANAENTQAFASEKELAKLAADWPAARLIELWNSFAGVTPFDDLKPVRKFHQPEGSRGPYLVCDRASFRGQCVTDARRRAGVHPVQEGRAQVQTPRYGAQGRERIRQQQEGRGNRPDEARSDQTMGARASYPPGIPISNRS